MIKALLIDLDGVIIIRDKYFSQVLAEQHNLDPDHQAAFFKGVFQDCMRGKADLRDVLPEWLERWNWTEGLDNFLKFWFTTESNIDKELLNDLASIKASGVKTYLATDNEINRTNYVLDDLQLRPYFDDIMGSALLGHKKGEAEYWETVIQKIAPTVATEALFIDDDAQNVELALQYGFKAHTFMKGDNLSQILNQY